MGRRGRGCSLKKKVSKNPYSARGLDKFSSLLADLEARRAEIVANAGPRGVAMVRFRFSNSNEWIPIVVKLRDPRSAAALKAPADVNDGAAANAPPPKKDDVERGKEAAVLVRKDQQKRWSWSRPSSLCWGWPLAAAAVVVLLSLVAFGRVFAVCCTTVGWYMVPIVQGEWQRSRHEEVLQEEGLWEKVDFSPASTSGSDFT